MFYFWTKRYIKLPSSVITQRQVNSKTWACHTHTMYFFMALQGVGSFCGPIIVVLPLANKIIESIM